MSYQKPIRHFLLLSSLYLLSTPLQAQTSDSAETPATVQSNSLEREKNSPEGQQNSPAQTQRNPVRTHQQTLQAKIDFIAEFDTNGDGSVSYTEFFQSRQQRLAVMDIHANVQITAAGYQAEYADRLDQRLAQDRAGQLKQTEIRFASVDTNQDGRITLAEYQASGARAFSLIDQNQDGVISQTDPAPSPRRQQAANTAANQATAQPNLRRRPALVMPTTHSVAGMLAMYDLDQDGQVSQAEYQQQRQAVFNHTDRDQNGELSPQEYLEEFIDRVDQQIAKTRDAQLKQALVRFKALDKDQNGVLSAPEYHQSGQRMFARWDTDNNRLVSLAEALPEPTVERTASRPATSAQAEVDTVAAQSATTSGSR